MEELIDVVDDSDRILGCASWKEVMDKHLIHRSSNVLVFNSEGLLFVHRRAVHLRIYPGLWDVKFGGSVRAGETYEQAGVRELREEAGIAHVRLEELFRMQTRRLENPVNRSVFKCVYDGKIALDESEVAEGKFMGIGEIRRLGAGGKLSPSAVDVFNEFLKKTGR